MKNTATRYLFRTLSLFFFLAFLQSCGGSGGGGSSSPQGILFYTLMEASNGNGSIVENAISPSGQLYPNAPPAISTNGTFPVTFVLDPPLSLAFALNSNSTSSSLKAGLIESYNTSNAQSSTGIQQVSSTTTTGSNPSSMAIDPGGNYLVVADHGSGSSSAPGDVEIFQIGSNGALSGKTALSASSLPTSTCPNPDKIVFPHSGSNGTSSDIFYVVCSSPELISSSPPAPALYQCSISGTCSQITLPSLSNSNAISNMEFASNGTAFLPGETYTSSSSSSYSAFLITCTGAPLSSCSNPSPVSSTTGTAPAGDFAIDNAPPLTAFIGNYSTNTSGNISNPGIFFSCTTTSCASPNLSYPSSGAATFLATNPGQTNLYIVSTAAPLPTTTSSISHTPSGTIFTCPLPSASSCTPTGTTANAPVGITFDPSGKFAFVPTWSGTISIFQVGANGSLTPAASPTVTTGSLNLQVVVP